MSPENIINRGLKLVPRIIDQVFRKRGPVTPLSTSSEEKDPVVNPVARPISEVERESLEESRFVVYERGHRL